MQAIRYAWKRDSLFLFGFTVTIMNKGTKEFRNMGQDYNKLVYYPSILLASYNIVLVNVVGEVFFLV